MTNNEIPAPPAIDSTRQRSRATRWLLAMLLLAAPGWWYLHRPPSTPAAAPAPLAVQVEAVGRRAMPVVLLSVGKVLAQSSAEIRPQASGMIRRVFISDGETVVRGQKLFELESQPLAAALAQAQAQWARDRALADDARAAQARLKPLADKEYVTAREYETAVNAARSLQAAAAASRAQVDQARIALGYSIITAPISGRAGAVLVKPGNLVAQNNPTPLIVINATQPVDLAFSMPQQQLRLLRDALDRAPPPKRLAVEARDSLSQDLRAVGELTFLDNAVSDSAGTLAARARFSNAGEVMWPGEFYAVRITLRTDDAAMVVPERALQQGQDGPFVYIVDDGRARMRLLRVDRVLDGLAVVSSGLQGGEAVLTAVPANLRDGTAVRIIQAPAAPAAPAARP